MIVASVSHSTLHYESYMIDRDTDDTRGVVTPTTVAGATASTSNPAGQRTSQHIAFPLPFTTASTTDPTQQNIGQQVGLGGQQTAQPANVMPSGSGQGASNLGPMMQISGGSVPFFIPPFKNPTGTLSHSHG